MQPSKCKALPPTGCLKNDQIGQISLDDEVVFIYVDMSKYDAAAAGAQWLRGSVRAVF